MTHTDLLPCPFCQKPLTVNPANDAFCQTPRCWMASRLIAIPLDVPDQVEAWNTRARTPDTAPIDDINIPNATTRAALDAAERGEVEKIDSVDDLITALRAAEAREQKLRDGLTRKINDPDLTMALAKLENGSITIHAAKQEILAWTRRALGGDL